MALYPLAVHSTTLCKWKRVPRGGVVYHGGPRKDAHAVNISERERTRSTKNNAEMDRRYEKQTTLVDCQTHRHSAPARTRPFIGFVMRAVLENLKVLELLYQFNRLARGHKMSLKSSSTMVKRPCPLESCEGQEDRQRPLCPPQPDVRESNQTSAHFLCVTNFDQSTERRTTEMSRIFDQRQPKEIDLSMFSLFSVSWV